MPNSSLPKIPDYVDRCAWLALKREREEIKGGEVDDKFINDLVDRRTEAREKKIGPLQIKSEKRWKI